MKINKNNLYPQNNAGGLFLATNTKTKKCMIKQKNNLTNIS